MFAAKSNKKTNNIMKLNASLDDVYVIGETYDGSGSGNTGIGLEDIKGIKRIHIKKVNEINIKFCL